MTENDSEMETISRWGGEEKIYHYLETQLAELCPIVCGANASLPAIQIKPAFLSTGLMHERNSGADYEPAEGTYPATIGIFTTLLNTMNKGHIRIVLAHELIHHWEHLGAIGASKLPYPHEADMLISAHYPSSHQQRRWRSGHSHSFISKAAEIAVHLKIPLVELLFETSRAKSGNGTV